MYRTDGRMCEPPYQSFYHYDAKPIDSESRNCLNLKKAYRDFDEALDETDSTELKPYEDF